MPMYEYQCQKCGKHFDVEQRMTDDALTIHDECGGPVVKVFSSAGIVLKGSGFYKTDARAGSATKKPGAKTDSGSSNSSNTESDKASTTPKKADSSPAAPAPKKSDS